MYHSNLNSHVTLITQYPNSVATETKSKWIKILSEILYNKALLIKVLSFYRKLCVACMCSEDIYQIDTKPKSPCGSNLL